MTLVAETTRLETNWARRLLSLSCALSAGVHLALVPEHTHESLILAGGFAATALALFSTGAWIERRPVTSRGAAAAAALLVVLIGLYAASRSIGLPGVSDAEPLDLVGALTQGVQLVGLAAALTLMLTLNKRRTT